jgi:hypothetical protein
MEVDLVVTSETQLIEPKVTFSIGILFDTTDGSDEVEGAAPLPITTPTEAITHCGATIDSMFSDTIAKEEQVSLVIQIDFIFGLYCSYFKLIFLGVKLIACSTIFYFLL